MQNFTMKKKKKSVPLLKLCLALETGLEHALLQACLFHLLAWKQNGVSAGRGA